MFVHPAFKAVFRFYAIASGIITRQCSAGYNSVSKHKYNKEPGNDFSNFHRNLLDQPGNRRIEYFKPCHCCKSPEEAIQKIYDYDWYCFCRNRAYERRATQMPSLEIDSPDDERRSALFRKNETLSVSFDESAFPDRYAWVDTLEDLRLLRAIKALNVEELEILTFLTLEEHSQKELAEKWGCSQRAISKKFQKIKKIFQKWF